MDKSNQTAVCYLPISKIPPSISEYVKSQKLNQMRTLLDSIGIIVTDIYVDEGFEQAPVDKPGLKRLLPGFPKKNSTYSWQTIFMIWVIIFRVYRDTSVFGRTSYQSYMFG